MPFSEYRKTHTGFMAAPLELNRLAKMDVYDVVEIATPERRCSL